MERIASQEERDWLDWLKRARDEKRTQRAAAERMGVSDRWVRKRLQRRKREGDRVVVHGLRGRASNRKIAAQVQAEAIRILKQPDWHDFGPTFAREQLAQRHRIQLSDETLRRWMMTAGLWKSKSRQREQVHCWRPRRSGLGELVQWDTSEHDGLEGRGEPVRYLVRMIDDATSWSWGKRGRTRPGGSGDAAGPGVARVGHRVDSSLFSPSQRASGTQLFHGPGPLGQAAAPGEDLDPSSGQRVSGEALLAGVECAVRAASHGFRQSASWPGAVGCSRDSVSRRAARHRQRLHLFLR
jgi:hypothetical protein